MHKKLLLLLQISRNRMHAYVKSQIVIKQSKCIWCLFNIRALNQFTFLIKGPLQDEVFEFNILHIQRNLLHRKLGYLYFFVRELYVWPYLTLVISKFPSKTFELLFNKGCFLLLGTWSKLYLFRSPCCSAFNLHFALWLFEAFCYCHF